MSFATDPDKKIKSPGPLKRVDLFTPNESIFHIMTTRKTLVNRCGSNTELRFASGMNAGGNESTVIQHATDFI